MLLIESIFLQSLAIALGACVGSFLNVVIYRVPAGLSILHPPSRCPHCLRSLAPRDNIPIIGWFLIKGKCRYCHTPVSWRYPAIEALTAFLFWSVAAYFGNSLSIPILCFYAAFLSWLLVLALIDIDTMTLPDRLTQSGLVLGLIYQVSLAFMSLTNGGDARFAVSRLLMFGIGGAVLGIWLLDIMRVAGSIFLQKEAMGGGDPKLAAMLGMWLGWQNLLLAILIASAIGTLVGAIALLVQKRGKHQPIPFGPFLALGGAISLFFGQTILSTYLSWFGLA
ncbi:MULTISPECIES: prepilin peptidase [Pseudanabaena]|uniref:Type 4 prepilin peptidase 1 n=1 Tax=Pseudanabaena biceps PCC 7429 TaxID=927668 RepID=L8MV92_9CYAN|nr:A24 family peptidase [Pseudanabaena biceps]ELS31862.1 type 4 prepilin peptidase 1 [Pseudanabaena biceps PCC 7429]